MNKDELSTDSADSTQQRRAIVSAIILAVAVAGVLWYFFVLNQPSTDENLITRPSDQPEVTVEDEDAVAPIAVSSQTLVPRIAEGIRDVSPSPAPIVASARTGTGALPFAAVLAATSGFIGWRRFAHQK